MMPYNPLKELLAVAKALEDAEKAQRKLGDLIAEDFITCIMENTTMDPKSKIAQATLDTVEAVQIINEWLDKGHTYYWERNPDALKADVILNNSRKGKENIDEISLLDFANLLDGCRTSKMPGNANRGLEYMKQEFKRRVKDATS